MAESNHTESYALLGDVPVKESARRDMLKFNSHATVLARAAIESEDPITIGVFGEWGTGKTSLMRLIKDVVEAEETAAAVWFNAWQYEKEEHLIVPLTATINKQLEKRLEEKWTGPIAEGAKSVRDALRAIAYGFSVKGKVGIPLISEAEINLSATDMIKRYQELTKDSVLARSLYFDAFELLEECRPKDKKDKKDEKDKVSPRIVVFVDDLDRCFPQKAVELLEGIKLVLNQPGFSFVLGVNDAVIQAFIEAKYSRECSIAKSYFRNYLDKIVQVKVLVPRREPGEMEGYIKQLLEQGGAIEEASQADLVPLIAEANDRNPRSIIRMLNRIMVTVRIGKLDGQDYDPVGLILEIATGDLDDLRKALNISVVVIKDEEVDEGDNIRISRLFADYLERESYEEVITGLNEVRVRSRGDELKKAVNTTALSRSPGALQS